MPCGGQDLKNLTLITNLSSRVRTQVLLNKVSGGLGVSLVSIFLALSSVTKPITEEKEMQCFLPPPLLVCQYKQPACLPLSHATMNRR